MIGIKDFGMPSCCVNCQMCDAYEKGMCVITDTECEDMYSQRNDDCPLVEITESDDCVSRQAILNELSKWDWQDLYLPIHFKELIIDELPNVQPKTNALFLDSDGSAKPIWVEREKGEWIKTQLGTVCNKCYRFPLLNKDENEILSNYCPYCGADMKTESEE